LHTQTLNCGNASPASFFSLVQNGQNLSIKEQTSLLVFTATSQRSQTSKLPSSDHLRPEYLFNSDISPPTRTMNYSNMNNSGMNHSNMNNAGMNHSNMNNNSGMNNTGTQGQRTGTAGKGPDFICKSKSPPSNPTAKRQEVNQIPQHSSRQTRAQIRWPKIQRSRQRCQKPRSEPENRQAHHDYCA
jgi:hypothetical protein